MFLDIASLHSHPNHYIDFQHELLSRVNFFYFLLFKSVFYYEISYVKIYLLLKFLLQY